jgi:serine/threonine protein kinase
MKKQLFAGKFEIQGEISKGKTGTIYYGYDMGLRQEVAIKIYHSHINGRLIRGQAFIEKSKPLLLIDHPNLIKIFKVEEEDDTPVVFMEFFDAPSLQQMIHDKGPLPVQDMLMLAREITEVLVHTHFQGIIHGTLHPGHVLVGPKGQIKVMDLGLSWILMDILSNCDEELLRPLPYFPPEIAKGDLLNVSSDLYCLGFMMYEMLTGRVPYAELPKTSIMGKLAFDQSDPPFDFPDTVPEAICDLIRNMTRNKTQQRLQDATHVLTILNQQLSKVPLSQDSPFSASVPSQPKAHAPIEQPKPKEVSASVSKPPTPTPTRPEEAPLKKTSVIQRPQRKSINDVQVKYAKIFWKIAIILGLIGLLVVAGSLGYWYRDLLEPNFATLQTQPEIPPSTAPFPATMPPESQGYLLPPHDSLNFQNSQSGKSESLDSASPALETPKEIGTDASSLPTPLAPASDFLPDPSKGTQRLDPSIAEPINIYTPTKEQSDLSQPSVSSEKPSSAKNPPVSGGLSGSTTKVPNKELLQKPSSPHLSQKTTREKGVNPSLIQSKEDITREPTDKEIEELLQALEAPSTDGPLLTETGSDGNP